MTSELHKNPSRPAQCTVSSRTQASGLRGQALPLSNIRRRRTLLLVLFCFMALSTVASANVPAALAGYREVTIAIGAIPEVASRAGIERTRLKVVLERALEHAGLRVLSPSDAPMTAGPVPEVSVELRMLRMPSFDGVALAFSMRLSCTRFGITTENGRPIDEHLWSADTLAAADRRFIRAQVEDSLARLAEAFLNDWRGANSTTPE